MKLKDYSREELEMMSYAELASIVLNDSKKKMKIAEIFQKIAKALGLTDAEYEDRISEFFEVVSTNKLFTILPQGYCDLKTRHNTKVVMDDEDEEDDEDIFYEDNEDDDIADDDLQDFVVIDEDEANS